MTDSLLDRFLRYVRLDTQADDSSSTYPSTAKQLVLSQLLANECLELGLSEIVFDQFGIVTATIPAWGLSPGEIVPAIVWVAHVDTSPEYSSTNVNPQVHPNYQGQDLVLPGNPSLVLSPNQFPELLTCLGHTLITTDGTTLLGADDKSGIAAIMTAAARLISNPQKPHGPIRLCFTCDEEIGRGTAKLTLERLNAVCGYTLDGSGTGTVDCETFSADQATIRVVGINTHPSIGKGVMVNAIKILSEIITRLPARILSPETTDERQGFVHPYEIEGGVAEAHVKFILRDFETLALAEQAKLLQTIIDSVAADYPEAKIELSTRPQYRNMREGLGLEPRAIEFALRAIQTCGLTPQKSIIRGGTDGSLLTAMGLPCPNLSTGEHNPHSPLEWTSVEEMEQAANVLVELAYEWGQNGTEP